MSTLSIRSLPRDVERLLVREARREGKTKTEIVLQALKERFGLTARTKRRAELRCDTGNRSAEVRLI